MNEARRVTIIGGGLAGLTLGIALRQRDVPVTLHEAGRYPRHRVCGEFINGRGRRTLETLGLDLLLREAGAHAAESASFHSAKTSAPMRRLPQPALCLSRFRLDALLADQFRKLGGELCEGNRWTGDGHAAGVVRASGRQPRPNAGGWRWFGLKAHARGVRLEADLEMHLSRDAYVGLTQLADGVVNVCGLFRRRGALSDVKERWPEYLRGLRGSLLHARLAHADFDEESFCAVAGLDLRPQRATTECRLGDALTMIPPVTGNGMSMAFESAELAIEPLQRWSCGEAEWDEAKRTIARRCDSAFSQRLRWARWLQSLMFVVPLQSSLVRWLAGPEWTWRLLFARTR